MRSCKCRLELLALKIRDGPELANKRRVSFGHGFSRPGQPCAIAFNALLHAVVSGTQLRLLCTCVTIQLSEVGHGQAHLECPAQCLTGVRVWGAGLMGRYVLAEMGTSLAAIEMA